ncbi:MAG: class B sortase [Erysipelotrichaceae bacterium]|nr:class B sortase [Erysipelotrichaceae bacterium]
MASLICLLGFGYFAYQFVMESQRYHSGDVLYQQLRSEEIVTDDDTVMFDFDELYQINSSVIAWIKIDDSVIDYPVVQGSDNEYYLNHLFDKTVNKMGSIFMDYRSNDDFSDRNTIIYGHNMKNGSMFAALTAYQQQDFYNTHQTISLYTVTNNYEVLIFAGFLTESTADYLQLTFVDDQDFLNYVAALRSASDFESTVSVDADDRLITLSTCAYDFADARYALYGIIKN